MTETISPAEPRAAEAPEPPRLARPACVDQILAKVGPRPAET